MTITSAGRELVRQIARNPAITDRELTAICAENAHMLCKFADYMPNLRSAKRAIRDRAEDAQIGAQS